MDTTNHKFGKVDMNILMLSVYYEGFAILLIWKLLSKRSNSYALERTDLLDKYIKLLDCNSIRAFLVDWYCIGKEKIEDVIYQEIPYYKRIQNNIIVYCNGAPPVKAFRFLNNIKTSSYENCNKLYYLVKNLVYFSRAKNFKKHWLVGVCNYSCIQSI